MLSIDVVVKKKSNTRLNKIKLHLKMSSDARQTFF